MRKYNVKTIVKESYSRETEKGLMTFEKGEEVILDRGLYEFLLSKGKVEKGEILEENDN